MDKIYIRATQAHIQVTRDRVLAVDAAISVAEGQIIMEFLLNIAGFTMREEKAKYPKNG